MDCITVPFSVSVTSVRAPAHMLEETQRPRDPGGLLVLSLHQIQQQVPLFILLYSETFLIITRMDDEIVKTCKQHECCEISTRGVEYKVFT